MGRNWHNKQVASGTDNVIASVVSPMTREHSGVRLTKWKDACRNPHGTSSFFIRPGPCLVVNKGSRILDDGMRPVFPEEGTELGDAQHRFGIQKASYLIVRLGGRLKLELFREFENESGEDLSGAFNHNTSLKDLSFFGNFVLPRRLSKTLPRCSMSIKGFKISRLAFSDCPSSINTGLAHIATRREIGHPSLKTVAFRLQEIVNRNEKIIRTTVQAVAAVIGGSKGGALENVSFGDDANEDAAALFAEAIASANCTVKSRKLDGNRFGNEGDTALAQGLRQNGSLHKLSLCASHIDSVGATALSCIASAP